MRCTREGKVRNMERASPSELLAELSPTHRATLEEASLLVCPHPAASGSQEVLGAAILNCTPDAAWQLAIDWERVGELIPADLQYRVVERDHARAPTRMRVYGRAKVALVPMSYTVDVVLDGARRVQEWSLCSPEAIAELLRSGADIRPNTGLIRALQGRASFTALGANQCLYVYENLLTPSAALPRMVEQYLARRSVEVLLRTMIKACDEKRS